MSVTALFRGKWGQKAQEPPEKPPVAAVHLSHEEDDDEDDSKVGFSREPIRRNSRFYRSMRKKRLASSEQSDSSTRPDHSPSNRAPVPHRSPLMPGGRRPQLSPQLHHSRTVLPSNGEASSRHALYNRDAVNKGRGGVGGGSVDISAASNSQHRDSPADMLSYRTHGVHSGVIRKLSEQTAAACTVQEARGIAMSSQQPSRDGADRDNANLRLLSNGGSSQTICHSLNIIKNIAFLYQEYRDTSKQQEIEQRRQRDNLSPEVTDGTGVGGSGVMSPPALQLQLRNSARLLSLWQNLEAVQASGLLTQLPQREIIMQEETSRVLQTCEDLSPLLKLMGFRLFKELKICSNEMRRSDFIFHFTEDEEILEN